MRTTSERVAANANLREKWGVVSEAWVASILLAVLAYGTDNVGLPMAVDLVRNPGAEVCPDRDTLVARVAAGLPKAVSGHAGDGASSARVSIAITGRPGQYAATITTVGSGVRNLVDDSEDCAGLAEALVLTLSMIADNQAIVPSPAATSPTVVAAASHSAPGPTRAWQFGASALVSTGILGATTPGVALDGLWRPTPRIAIGLSGWWLPARSIDGGGGSTSVALMAGMASLCGSMVPFGGRLLPALCAETAVGGLRGASQGYDRARSVWAPWLVLGASADLGLRVSQRVYVTARTGYLLSLRDAHFAVGGLGRVYDSGHPGWFASLGTLVKIP